MLDLGDQLIDALAHVLATLIELEDLALEHTNPVVPITQLTDQAGILLAEGPVLLDELRHHPLEAVEAVGRVCLTGNRSPPTVRSYRPAAPAVKTSIERRCTPLGSGYRLRP